MKSDDVDRLIEQRKAQALDEMVAENQRLGLYDDAPEVTPEVTPYADTSAHKAENVTGNVDAVNMSQDRVDETAKGEHEPVVIKVTNCDLRKEKNS